MHNPSSDKDDHQSGVDGDLMRGIPAGREREFRICLENLEGNAASFILVGQVDRDAIANCIKYQFGVPENDRKRVLVVTDGGIPEQYLPGRISPDHADVRVFEYPLARGSASAVTSPTPTSSENARDAGESDVLATIREDLHTACENLRPPSPTTEKQPIAFEPDAFRVALSNLEPIVEQTGLQETTQWLKNDFLPLVRRPSVRGRTHIAYSRPDDGVVDELMTDPGLFDVKVVVRRDGGTIQRKWVLPADRHPVIEPALETNWMTL